MTVSSTPSIFSPPFSPEAMQLGRSIITLKRDYEEIARAWESLAPDARRRHELANMAPQIERTTGKYVYAFSPDNFIFSALGLRRWSHATYESNGKHELMRVDPWLVAGGFRKPAWIAMSQTSFLPLAQELDADTVAGKTSGSSSHWLQPFALFWAGEGKNRIQLYQDANRPLLTSADTCRFLPSEALRLYKSVIDSTVWLVRYVPEALPQQWAQRMYHLGGDSNQAQILPFPEVVVPLLKGYGVKVDRGWCLPWRISKAARAEESRFVRSRGWS